MGDPVLEAVARPPSPALRPLVASYVGWRQENLVPRLHRGLPSRHLTLVLGLDGPVQVAAAPDPAWSGGTFAAVLGGLHATPAMIAQPARQEGVQIAITPLGARVLLGLPAAALASGVVDLRDLRGRRAADLVEQVAATGDWPARFMVLDAVLAAWAADAPRTSAPDEVTWAWRRLLAASGRVGVAELAAEVGWSRRHLAERFRRELGLSPKVAARVIRFEQACGLLRRAPRRRLADVAATCGFADQSHLVREWHVLAGCAPRTWMAEELPFVQDGDDAAGGG